MKLLTKAFLFISISFFLIPQFSQLQAQKTIQAKRATTEKVKPLNARTLKLNSNASKILSRWKNAKHMELLKTGHFIPMQNPSANTSGSLPGGMPTSFADGTNCAKIECPDVFGPDVTCWECH